MLFVGDTTVCFTFILPLSFLFKQLEQKSLKRELGRQLQILFWKALESFTLERIPVSYSCCQHGSSLSKAPLQCFLEQAGYLAGCFHSVPYFGWSHKGCDNTHVGRVQQPDQVTLGGICFKKWTNYCIVSAEQWLFIGCKSTAQWGVLCTSPS